MKINVLEIVMEEEHVETQFANVGLDLLDQIAPNKLEKTYLDNWILYFIDLFIIRYF